MGKEQFNQAIIDKLVEYEIADIDTALLYLLAIFYELDDSAIPLEVQQRVNLTKIVTRDYSQAIRAAEQAPIVWNIPLLISPSAEEGNWKWVEGYRGSFEALRSDAKGDAKATLTKMKKFFAENPHVRMAQVRKATEMYLDDFRSGRQEVKFLQRADYFISKKIDGVYTSRLSNYVETVIKMEQTEAEQSTGQNRFMQNRR